MKKATYMGNYKRKQESKLAKSSSASNFGDNYVPKERWKSKLKRRMIHKHVLERDPDSSQTKSPYSSRSKGKPHLIHMNTWFWFCNIGYTPTRQKDYKGKQFWKTFLFIRSSSCIILQHFILLIDDLYWDRVSNSKQKDKEEVTQFHYSDAKYGTNYEITHKSPKSRNEPEGFTDYNSKGYNTVDHVSP